MDFVQHLVKQLYLPEQGSDDRGFLALVLPQDGPTEPISLDQALHDESLSGSFVFSAAAPELTTVAEAEGFVQAVLKVIQGSAASRAFVWLREPSNITSATVAIMGISVGGGSVVAGLQGANITLSLSLEVEAGMKLDLPSPGSTVLELGDASTTARILFAGPSSPSGPQAIIVTTGSLPFTGTLRGCIQFNIFLQRQFLNDKFNWGFQFLFPIVDPVRPALSEWLPLASGNDPNPTQMLGFTVSVDPSDVLNNVFDPCHASEYLCDVPLAYNSRRTFLNFTGANFDGQQTVLASYYRTIFGDPLTLVPVPASQASQDMLPGRLVFTIGERISDNAERFQVAPEGDFVLQVIGPPEGQIYDLLCGLQGTEFFSFQPQTTGYTGDRLRFLSRQPAYAPNFPFQAVSSVGPPMDLDAKLLDKGYMTSWAAVRRGSSTGNVHYVAQPEGSPLFGCDDVINPSHADLLGQRTPGYVLPQDLKLSFPLPPYAGVTPGNGQTSFSKAQIESYERQVVEPTRRGIIGAVTSAMSISAQASLSGQIDTDETFNVTTPSGLIATVTGSDQGGSRWSKILLGQNQTPELMSLQMYFGDPNAKLQQAFQTNDLFLVVANGTNLGTPGGTTGPSFHNLMNIEDWPLEAKVGQTNQYNDYNNVIIIKGCQGKLYDPDGPSEDNLVSNPDKWTQRADFSWPTTVDNSSPDPNQMVILSQWLQEFFQDASQQRDVQYFENFNRIARSSTWTGILILKMTINKVPDDLAGITAGITQPQDFNAHHFAIQISQVQNNNCNIGIVDASSMFGLIYYVDPAFVAPPPDKPVQPIVPPVGIDYDFRLLTLKVLFENTTIRDFQSYAQVTVSNLFGMPVEQMGEGGNPYNTIVLRGSYQNNNGQPVYSLDSTSTNTFYFDSNVFNKIEITQAQMSTRDSGDKNVVSSWFGFTGFLDFKIVEGRAGAFDIFSFGNEADADSLRKGLSFSNLGLQMSFPGDNPVNKAFAFVAKEMRFDIATSTPRAASLFVNFALDLQGLQSGPADTPPSKHSYLTVITDAQLTGVEGGQWYGLRYQLNMGTPGELAGKIGLTSYLLTAWSPDSSGEGSYRALVGLELPGTGSGAPLISLETVLKLSIGQVWLTIDYTKNSFLLMLTDIALKFMGLLKIPPGGSTLFYLFGNPQSEGKASGLGWYAMYRQKAQKTAEITEGSDATKPFPGIGAGG